MGLRIKTNIASLNAQRRLAVSTDALQNTMAKLSSGQRINKAADDAAGLAISTKLNASIRSLNQSKRNAADGVSIVQTAEGGLEETSSMLIRLRELAIQAASDTVGNPERGYIQKEVNAIKDEIDRIANSTEFNGTRLLIGQNAANWAPKMPDTGNAFPLEIQVGKDYYAEADSLEARNPVNVIRIDLSKVGAYANDLGIGSVGTSGEILVENKESAQRSISVVDGAITKVSDYRSYLGALQNRLRSGLSTLSTQMENLSEAKSRIIDTDFAEETATLTQSQILQQAGTSVLSQANVQPKIALSLLQNI